MSKEIGIIIDAGPKEQDLKITQFWGGKNKGVCIQLTQYNERNKRHEYIQLSIPEFKSLKKALYKYVIKPDDHIDDFLVDEELENENM